jgi:hypothetical protein
MKRTIMEYGSVIVDVYDDTLVARMINRAGRVRDLFNLVKRGKVEQVRLALPWQPEEYKKTNEVKEIDYKVLHAPPVDYKVLIPQNAEWQYLAGEHPQGLNWTHKDYDTSNWKRGAAGFGFSNPQLRTQLRRERGKPASIYLRREFTIDQADKVTEIGLMIDYRDGFVAYLNGREVARVGIGRSSGRNAQKIKQREDSGVIYVQLNNLTRSLKDGVNLLAIEAHVAPEGIDLQLDPYLILED